MHVIANKTGMEATAGRMPATNTEGVVNPAGITTDTTCMAMDTLLGGGPRSKVYSVVDQESAMVASSARSFILLSEEFSFECCVRPLESR